MSNNLEKKSTLTNLSSVDQFTKESLKVCFKISHWLNKKICQILENRFQDTSLKDQCMSEIMATSFKKIQMALNEVFAQPLDLPPAKLINKALDKAIEITNSELSACFLLDDNLQIDHTFARSKSELVLNKDDILKLIENINISNEMASFCAKDLNLQINDNLKIQTLNYLPVFNYQENELRAILVLANSDYNKEQNQFLELCIKAVYTHLQYKRKIKEQALQNIKEITGVVSHKLNPPLQVILSTVELINMIDTYETTPEEIQILLKNMIDSVKQIEFFTRKFRELSQSKVSYEAYSYIPEFMDINLHK